MSSASRQDGPERQSSAQFGISFGGLWAEFGSGRPRCGRIWAPIGVDIVASPVEAAPSSVGVESGQSLAEIGPQSVGVASNLVDSRQMLARTQTTEKAEFGKRPSPILSGVGLCVCVRTCSPANKPRKQRTDEHWEWQHKVRRWWTTQACTEYGRASCIGKRQARLKQ